jgi:hypothetical protein
VFFLRYDPFLGRLSQRGLPPEFLSFFVQYRIEFWDRYWPQNAQLRHIFLLATAPNGRTTQEAILRVDRQREAKKLLMDSLRAIARNVFYRALAPFKKAYNNYSTGTITISSQSAGVLEVTTESVGGNIMPRVSYSPQLRRIILKVFEELNTQKNELPDESSRKLIFRLADRTELSVTQKNRNALISDFKEKNPRLLST